MKSRPWRLTSTHRTVGTATWFSDDIMSEKGISPEKLIEKIKKQADSFSQVYDNVTVRGVISTNGGITVFLCGDHKE